MDLYHIVLYVHILTLLIAAGATAIMKLAMSRRARARTLGDVLDWHGVIMSTSKAFPICLVLFVATGTYMLRVNRVNVWSTGFVAAGVVGVVLLLVSGMILATKGKALTQMLQGMVAQHGAEHAAPALSPPPFVGALPFINTGIALGVAFDMVTKPVSIPVALSVVAVGVVLGAAVGMRAPAPGADRVPAA